MIQPDPILGGRVQARTTGYLRSESMGRKVFIVQVSLLDDCKCLRMDLLNDTSRPSFPCHDAGATC